jgi:hypothetical protein
MNPIKFKAVSLAILFQIFLAGLTHTLPGASIQLLISTRNNGVLRDCECGDDCHGGLAERATLIDGFRNAGDEILLLDGGDFSTTIGRQRNDEFVIQAYSRLKYDAVAVGDQEFRNGPEFFQQKTLASNLPLVCANLRSKAAGKFMVQPFILKEIQGIKIAVTGCISPAALNRLDPQKYYPMEILPVEPALQQLLPTLAAQAEVVVLLAQVTNPELETIARTIPGISVIIAGHQPALPEESLQEKYGKIIVSAGVESAHLAHLTLHLNAINQLENYDFDLICIGPETEEEPGLKNLIDSYFAEFEILNHKLGPASLGLPFFGPEYCRQCHVLAYENWRTSQHAGAFETLKLKNAAANRDCWPCHSMFGEEAKLPPESQQIGCEACHVQKVDPAKEPHPELAAKTRCLRCHTPQYSPEFDFEAYWQKIKH